MLRKITISLLSLCAAFFLWIVYVIVTDVFMVGYGWRMDRAWDKVENDTFISEIGRWGSGKYQEKIDLKHLFDESDVSREGWVTMMEGNQFKISEKNGVCGWASAYSNFMLFLSKYETCGVRIIGSSSCTYAYIVAVNFNDETLQEAVGTYSEYICL